MKPTVSSKQNPLSRREQKKASIRANIVEAAHFLFEKSGFDNVTVAEVAKRAKISVKTLFQYFPTKEDIVFENEMELAGLLVRGITARKSKDSVLDAAVSIIFKLIKRDPSESLSQLEGFARMTDNPVLKSRLQMMWLRYEDVLTQTIQEEIAANSGDPRPRLVSMQIIALLRLLTSKEARMHLGQQKLSRAALSDWLKGARHFVGRDIGDYGSR